MYNHTQQPNYQEQYGINNRMYPSPVDSSSPPKIVYYNNNSNMPPLMERPFPSRFHQQFYHESPPSPNAVDSNVGLPEKDRIVSPSSPNSVEDEVMQKNMQIMFEKKRRRRESHNAVERRRRENINDRISELATLLPDSRDTVKSNKGTILRKSVEHIKRLHDKLRQHQEEIRELENTLELCRARYGQQIIPPGHSLPSLDLSALNYHSSSTNKHV